MKPASLAALFLAACVSGSATAQPPEGRPEGDRPQGQEGRPGREGRPERGGQEGRPGEGRPEGGPGFGGGFGGPGGPGFGGEGGRMRMPNPLMEAIDTDKDGELSPDEISNAVAALKSLDKNTDGRLDVTEMRPNFEGMGRGGFPGGGFGGGGFPGGPGGPGGEGGPGREGSPGGDPGQMAERLMQMDANADGKLSKEEMPERLQSMFARADKNEDGSLDKEEMMAVSRERAGGNPGGPGEGQRGPGGPGGDFIGQVMERADTDKDGKLTGDEIPEFMRGRLEQSDTNKDGSLDKPELEAIGARMRGGRGEGGRRGNRPPVEGEGDQKPADPPGR